MSESPERLRKRARAAYKAELYPEAAAYYDALRDHPENPSSAGDHVEHAIALMRSGEPRLAESAFRAAAALAPEDGAIQTRLGQLMLKQGRTQAALECFRQAASLTPDAEAYWQLFQIEQSLGNHAEAEHALQSCLAMDPGHERAREVTEKGRDLRPGSQDALANGPEIGDAAFADLVQFIQNRPGEDSPGPAQSTSVRRRPLLTAVAAAAAFVLLYVWSRSQIF